MRSAQKIFTENMKGYNFMTPNVESYKHVENGVAEIASGSGMDKNTLYSVTVLTKVEDKYVHDVKRSALLYSMEEANEHVNRLKVKANEN